MAVFMSSSLSKVVAIPVPENGCVLSAIGELRTTRIARTSRALSRPLLTSALQF